MEKIQDLKVKELEGITVYNSKFSFTGSNEYVGRTVKKEKFVQGSNGIIYSVEFEQWNGVIVNFFSYIKDEEVINWKDISPNKEWYINKVK